MNSSKLSPGVAYRTVRDLDLNRRVVYFRFIALYNILVVAEILRNVPYHNWLFMLTENILVRWNCQNHLTI